ncbi:NAD(P)H dehydrogenase (quinone) [Kribbella orskensis]|uniref:NAD(P)H dehydrogenase (Quinone) n=1 Tax=Kribbella orskensis TaxID=2512216 RepID=A0ABY2BFB3_9ACTN|nr:MULTISPECIES: NAD(P)H-binding protein [Kribbella]TCN37008.1 NAD(P)H dehydrogenase (quinone) [Kribbella sp. VKM Ac-2500]TCO18433.1 NAD(P)H dehydrogenase (quinone) [Kribbella orskensis]
MSIVITGATGELGRLVIADLLAAGVPADGITAVARNPEKAAGLVEQGVRLLVADYDQPDTFDGAFQTEDRVLLVSASDVGRRVTQHAVVIDAARAAGVAQVAYTSIFDAPNTNFGLAQDHRETEQLILDAGLPYTFLRNDWYNEAPGVAGDLQGTVERGVVANGVSPDARLASAARADYAAAAAVVLSTEGHLNKAYELSGDTAWTYPEFAAEVSRQSGKTVVHQFLGRDENAAMLTSVGIPQPFAEILAEVDEAISHGALAGSPGDLSRLIGRPTTPLADTITATLR